MSSLHEIPVSTDQLGNRLVVRGRGVTPPTTIPFLYIDIFFMNDALRGEIKPEHFGISTTVEQRESIRRELCQMAPKNYKLKFF